MRFHRARMYSSMFEYNGAITERSQREHRDERIGLPIDDPVPLD